MPPRIEALLSARLFMAPQLVDNRLYFVSNLSGRFSLYAMDYGGSVPEPLLPPHIALQNPELVEGYAFCVFPARDQIVVMIDKDGDEMYQPMVIPLDGGFPEPAFGDALAGHRVYCTQYDAEQNYIYLVAASEQEAINTAYQGNMEAQTLREMAQSRWGSFVDGVNADHSRAILIDVYSSGDHVLYLWTQEGERRRLYGTPLEERGEGQIVPPNSIANTHFTPGNRGLLCITALFDDTYSLGYLRLDEPDSVEPVAISGMVHSGVGELTGLRHLLDDRYQVDYNIDGASWIYEGSFDEPVRALRLDAVVCGEGTLVHGVVEGAHFDKGSNRYAISFSTAASPTQLYTVEGADRATVVVHTRERIMGIPEDWLSLGEDASFISYDGLRISARLYLPAEALGFAGPRPLIYYIHGGPQGQERPNFAWFSMPLIQFLTLNGFAVFVPNVRGSTGYGLSYMKWVDRDWGGKDRLDHVHAMGLLAQDQRLDAARAAVTGRSYGGYMTLTLAARHPELWSAAADLFGPYKLMDFMNRVPETWKPYFKLILGDPETDRDFLNERSPSTYIDDVACPMLVIQGQNDPRVIEQESREVVERLRSRGKEVEYLLFENEGHDIIKYENKVRCYNAMAEFFARHLHP